MATSQNSFTMGLLPERHIDKRAVAAGYSVLVVFFLVLVNLGIFFPERMAGPVYHLTELIPMPALKPEPEPPPVKIKPQIHPKLLPKAVFETPKLIVPKEVRKVNLPEPEVPKVVMNQFTPPAIKIPVGGARPQLLHTGDFEGSSKPPTVNAAVEKVQTGGFGDPNGLKGTGKQAAKLYAAAAGGFDMPVGAGQGNGTGGAKGIKGTIASADFGNGVATGGKGDGRSSGAGVQTGGFGSEQVVKNTPHTQLDQGPPTNPVEIISKPNPVYTEEARNLKLEGEVLLEVQFLVNGTLHVNRVVRGLGHGLDEAAVAAANKIKFKPALRNGQPVDSTAVVHVVFQMAY